MKTNIKGSAWYLIHAILIFYYGRVYGQDTISTNYVKQHTYEFQITNQTLSGKGSDFFKREFNSAQFVLIGENHGDAKISEFTQAILPDLAKAQFRYFALETGPVSTTVLNKVCRKGSVRENLNKFYTDYYKKVKDIPIPFFEGKEDADFLQTAINQNFILFGIDQEYYSSTLLLLDELLSLDSNSKSKEAHKTASDYVIQEQLKDSEKKNYPLHKQFLESKELAAFFNSLDQRNEEVAETIDQLTKSWKMYAIYDDNRSQNLNMRAKHMKSEFARNYKKFAQAGSLPKVLVKMGSSHTQKGITMNSVYDIGSMLNELADFNGTSDLNISFLFRYFEDDEEPEGYFDNSIGSSNWLKERRPLLEQGQKENWVAIDLRSIKEDIINKKVWAYPAIKRLMSDVDLIVIPPMDRDIELNYSK